MQKEKKIKKEITLIKYEAKKRLVYGVVYAPMIPDSQDHFMTTETIEKSAHLSGRKKSNYLDTIQLFVFSNP